MKNVFDQEANQEEMKIHRISIIFFANLKEKAGAGRLEVDVPEGCTVGDLKLLLKKQVPQIGPQLANVVVLINKHNIYLDEDVIPVNAEVTFLPPIAGGQAALNGTGGSTPV